MTSVSMLAKLRVFTTKYPLAKGMLAYSVLWPTGCLIQQTIEGKTWSTFDWKKCLRYSLYGACFTAPTLYGWVKFTSILWPKTNFKSGISKAIIDQVSYGPFSMCCFFVGMSLLEQKTIVEGFDELRCKFIPTYKVGVCFWPILQTINFSVVPERNRVLFVSVCSVIWTTFLAYMKQLENEKDKDRFVSGSNHSQ